MTDDGGRGVGAASDPGSERLEELQFTLGEGPCVDAYAARRPVMVPDLADGAMTRWPVYAPAVHAEGVRAVFAFPLQIGAARLGVLDVFRDRSGPLTADELWRALLLADATVGALLDRHDHDGADAGGDGSGRGGRGPRRVVPGAGDGDGATRGSVSVRPWPGCAPTLMPRTVASVRWPATSSPAGCASTRITDERARHDGGRRRLT